MLLSVKVLILILFVTFKTSRTKVYFQKGRETVLGMGSILEMVNVPGMVTVLGMMTIMGMVTIMGIAN